MTIYFDTLLFEYRGICDVEFAIFDCFLDCRGIDGHVNEAYFLLVMGFATGDVIFAGKTLA